jgi:hypothetical protein
LRAVRGAPAQTGIGAVLVAGAAWLGTTSWLRGYHGLATPPQEHDTVLHTLITAWIARTGHAAPWQVMPTDLATGGAVSFYPSGVHTVAGLLAGLVDDPVRGLNATTALVIGLVAPVTLFAAAAGFEPVRTRPAFAALAALLSVTLYRPSFQLAHDAGILAFGMGLALVPAVAVGLRGLGRRDWGTAVGLAVAALGLFTIHPSVAVIAIGVLVIGWGTALLSSSDVRTWTRDRLLPLGVTAVVAAVVAAPWVLAGLSVAGSVASYPEAPPVSPLGDVLRATALFRYGGFIETGQALYQTGFAVLFWLGMLGCLTSRRLWPLAAAWLVWAAAATSSACAQAAPAPAPALTCADQDAACQDGQAPVAQPEVAGVQTSADDARQPGEDEPFIINDGFGG